MLTALVAALGAAGWALWLVARGDLRDEKEAHDRLRLADAAASALRVSRDAEVDARHAAEAQVRIAAAEARSLRMALSLAEADRESLSAQVRALGSDPSGEMYDSTSGRLRLYGKRGT